METDEQTARRASDLITETFAGSEIAVSLVDKGSGRWTLVFYLAAGIDRDNARKLITIAAGSAAAKAVRFAPVAAQDWVRESLAGLRPVTAGRFAIHGAHDRLHVPANSIGIEIEAALAFGTGHHGTTRGCLLALDRICKGPRRRLRILDLGAGSGVLAIAAARAMRLPVLATDIDSSAVRSARANASLNRVGALVEVIKAAGVTSRRLRQRAPFDLVFANILLRPLQRLAAPLKASMARSGRLVLSGLLSSQANAAIAAYQPLALVRRIDLDGWTTLVMMRRMRRTDVVRRPRRP